MEEEGKPEEKYLTSFQRLLRQQTTRPTFGQPGTTITSQPITSITRPKTAPSMPSKFAPKTLAPVKTKAEIARERERIYETIMKQYAIENIDAISKQALNIDCDQLFQILKEEDVVSGYNPDTQAFDEGTFARGFGTLFGEFDIDTEPGSFILRDFAETAQALPESTVDAMLQFGSLENVFYTVLKCFWEDAPSDVYRQQLAQQRTQELQLIRQQVQETQQELEALNIAKALTAAAYNIPLSDEQIEDCEFYLQQINGDGACMYRSIASAMLYQITGRNFGQGYYLSRDVLAGVSEAYKWEDYTGQTLATIVLNTVTKWVKFYTYVIMCTDISADSISFEGGIMNQENIIPITDPREYIQGGDTIMDKVEGVFQETPGSIYVPALKTVIQYALWIVLNICKGQPGSYIWVVDTDAEKAQAILAQGKVNLRDYFLPILAVPWFSPYFNATEQIPNKEIYVFDVAQSQWFEEPVSLTIHSSDAYTRVLNETGNEKLAWDAFVRDTRQYRTFGGDGETKAFSSIFYGSDTTFQTPIIYYFAETEFGPTMMQFGGAIRSVKPVIPYDVKIDARSQLCIIFGRAHYESLLPINPRLEAKSKTQLSTYILGEEAFPIEAVCPPKLGVPREQQRPEIIELPAGVYVPEVPTAKPRQEQLELSQALIESNLQNLLNVPDFAMLDASVVFNEDNYTEVLNNVLGFENGITVEAINWTWHDMLQKQIQQNV